MPRIMTLCAAGGKSGSSRQSEVASSSAGILPSGAFQFFVVSVLLARGCAGNPEFDAQRITRKRRQDRDLDPSRAGAAGVITTTRSAR